MLRLCYVVKWAPVTLFKTALEHIHAVYHLIRGWQNFNTVVIFGAFCMCRDFFFWGESSGCWKQETLLPHESACSVYGTRTASMVACKSTYKAAESQKVDSVLETLRCNKTHHSPNESACSVYEYFTARMLVCKSAYKPAEGQKSRLCVLNFALCKQVALLSHESACSMFGPRTARTLAWKST